MRMKRLKKPIALRTRHVLGQLLVFARLSHTSTRRSAFGEGSDQQQEQPTLSASQTLADELTVTMTAGPSQLPVCS